MRKTCVKVVNSVWRRRGISLGFYHHSPATVGLAVRNITTFTPACTQFVYNFLHRESIRFTPVTSAFIPSFHSTYNKPGKLRKGVC